MGRRAWEVSPGGRAGWERRTCPTDLFSSLRNSDERWASASIRKDTLKIQKMRVSPGLAVRSPKAELNRCLWLIEAQGRTALSLRSWSDARAQSSPPAPDRQTAGRRAVGRSDGPFPSRFGNAKLLSQKLSLGKIVIYKHYAISPSELQAVLGKKLNLKCFCAAASPSCGSVNGFQIPSPASK